MSYLNKICFLATDDVMRKQIEKALWNYSKGPENVSVEVTVLDFENVVEQARTMIDSGALAIVASGGTYQELVSTIQEVPVLRLYISTYDIIYALERVKDYKKIYLLLNAGVIFEDSVCSENVRNKVEIYTYKDRIELQEVVDNLMVCEDTAIVGTAILPRITDIPLPIITIMPSNPTIYSLYQHAKDLALYNQRERQQLSLFTTVLSQVEEGIIIYDFHGDISHINAKARKFLSIQLNVTHMSDIFPQAKKEQNIKFSDVIIEKKPYTLVLNSSSFKLGKRLCNILNIRDVTQLQRMEKNIRYKLAKTGLVATHRFSDILTVDERMKEVKDQAAMMAAYDVPVLIQGESGTGKELFAQSIHNASDRCHGPFVAVNCAALPPELLESELFGYEGGAFTGARREGKAGLFELAHQGTIFLDEINSMSPSIQAKLLRVLESRQVMRIGSDYVISLDIRIISATNVDIIEKISQGTFHKDLYFRLNTLTLMLPTLDERVGDILYLFCRFLSEYSGEVVNQDELPENLRQALLSHHWWGNIREIRSTALRYHIYGDAREVDYNYLFDQAKQQKKTPLIDPQTFRIDMKKAQNTFQKLVINDLLELGYTKTEVASMLNITRQTLFNRLK